MKWDDFEQVPAAIFFEGRAMSEDNGVLPTYNPFTDCAFCGEAFFEFDEIVIIKGLKWHKECQDFVEQNKQS